MLVAVVRHRRSPSESSSDVLTAVGTEAEGGDGGESHAGDRSRGRCDLSRGVRRAGAGTGVRVRDAFLPQARVDCPPEVVGHVSWHPGVRFWV